jgi:hypothetical protein
MRLTPLLCLLCAIGCATPDPTPQVSGPAQAPKPAPPTAIRLLIMHKEDLALNAAQLSQLEALAAKLDAQNAPLQKQADELDAVKKDDDEDETPPPRTGGGRRGGGGMGMSGGGMGMGGGRMGMGGGGMGMGGGRRGMGGGGWNRPATGNSEPPAKRPAAKTDKKTDKAASLRAEMADNHAAAVNEAWDILHHDQQASARTLLEANDYQAP